MQSNRREGRTGFVIHPSTCWIELLGLSLEAIIITFVLPMAESFLMARTRLDPRIRRAALARPPQFVERSRAAGDRQVRDSPRCQVVRNDLAIHCAVVYDKRARRHRARNDRVDHPMAGDMRALLKWQREMKFCSLPWLAFEFNLSSHLLNQLRRNGKTKPCAAETSIGRSIPLDKGLKQTTLDFPCDSDTGIDHFAMQDNVVTRRFLH